MHAQSFDQRTVRVSHSVSLGEAKYVTERKGKILECIQSHGIDCQRDDVPHIAILGSGGGVRAVVGLLGSLLQLEEENLLDCSLYLCGVSGSAWCMSSLYREPDWSDDVQRAVAEMMDRLTRGHVTSEDSRRRLRSAVEEEDFSLTDVWAATVVAHSMGEMDTRHLSEESTRKATNPYPIYSVIDRDYDGLTSKGTWFEITPHEAGYSDLGAFVGTAFLGSRFQGGRVEKVVPEMDVLRLQGMLGSAVADPLLVMKEKLEKWIGQWLTPKDQVDGAAGREEKMLSDDEILVILWAFLQKLCLWEWGTISNFLHKCQKSEIPTEMQAKEKIHLIDAGLYMNSPYPPVLRQERGVDLILSLDFSTEDPFETLHKAVEYSSKMKKPFPDVDRSRTQDKDCPLDFYVFEGTGLAPTVIHMPLFNVKNCQGGEPEIRREWKEYHTFKRKYTAEQTSHLLDKAAMNIRNNKANILSQIEKAVGRRRQRN